MGKNSCEIHDFCDAETRTLKIHLGTYGDENKNWVPACWVNNRNRWRIRSQHYKTTRVIAKITCKACLRRYSK